MMPSSTTTAESEHYSHASRCRTHSRIPSTVLELLRPGSFVKLRNQPADLPPFQLIQCRGGRCWVRQQAWGPLVQWEVAHKQLVAAEGTKARSQNATLP
jgi:hypothetical protein